MRRRRPEPKNEEPLEDWLLSYADMITLIMAFFVLLAAISKVDLNLYEKIQSGMAKEIGKRTVTRPIEQVRNELSTVVATVTGAANEADVGSDERGVVVNVDAGAMFKPGSAELRPEIMPLLSEISKTLAEQRFESYRVEIQGHTDDTPIAKGSAFPSNFDLAAARALSTMRTFQNNGVEEDRMLVSSFGQYAPRVPNHLEDGTPLPANQALNRRISIRVYPR